MNKIYPLIAFGYLRPVFRGRGISLSQTTAFLCKFFRENRIVFDASIARIEGADKYDWTLASDDLEKNIDLLKFDKAAENWVDAVGNGKIPADEAGIRKCFRAFTLEAQNTAVGKSLQPKPKKKSLKLPDSADAGPETPEKLDDASWHIEGDFPQDLEPESAFTHIGYYLAWICLNGYYSSSFLIDFKDDISEIFRREITPGTLAQRLDGKLLTTMMCNEVAEFSRFYLKNSSAYFEDLAGLSIFLELPSPYHCPDTWEAYALIAKHMTKAFKKWKKNNG